MAYTGDDKWLGVWKPPASGSVFGQLFGGGSERPPITGGATLSPQFSPERTEGWGAGNWWETPNVHWSTPSTATGALIEGTRQPDTELALPSWASDYADPQSFYNAYRGWHEDLRPGIVGSMQSAAAAEAKNEAALQAAREQLLGTQGEMNAAYELWEADPFRTAALTGLQEQAAPGYDVISDKQQAANDLQIAQMYARNLSAAQASAAGRGVAGGGVAAGQQAAIRSYADAAGLDLAARTEGINKQARQNALAALGQLSSAYGRTDLAWQNSMAEVSRGLAAIDAGVDYQPTDFTTFDMLSFAMERERAEAEQIEQYMDQWGQQQETDLLDLILPAWGIKQLVG